MQEILKALLPGITDGDMHTPAHKLAILISREWKGLSGSYFYFFPYVPALCALYLMVTVKLKRVPFKEEQQHHLCPHKNTCLRSSVDCVF